MTRARRCIASVGFVAVAAVAVGAAVATAQTVGGAPTDRRHVYALNGVSTGLSFYYNRENLLPLSPILDTGFPRASASIDDTPSSSGRGSPSDPGIAGALGAIGPQVGVPAGIIPTFPLYADANFPAGPPSAEVGNRQDVPLGGGPLLQLVSGRAEAAEDQASAQGVVGRLTAEPTSVPFAEGSSGGVEQLRRALAPLLGRFGGQGDAAATSALVSVGAAETKVRVHRDGERLTATVTSEVSDVGLLGGLIGIDGLSSRTTLDWASPSAEPALSTTSDLGAATLLGVPIRFTEDGFEFASQDIPAPVVRAVREAFVQFAGDRGAGLSLGEPVRGDGRAGITAVAFSFDGEFVPPEIPRPPLPLVGQGERDTVKIGLAGTSLSYVSRYEVFEAMEAPGGGDALSSIGSADLDTGTGSAALTGIDTPSVRAPDGGGAVPSDGGSVGEQEPTEEGQAVELITAAALGRVSWIAVLMVLGGLVATWLLTAGRFRLFAR